MKLRTKAEVAALVGYHPVHVMRLADEGKFPKPIKLGNQKNAAVRFIAEEVEAWIADRMAARSQRGGEVA